MGVRPGFIIGGMQWYLAQAVMQNNDVPVPVSTDWAPALLLTILWIFVAAAIAGSLMRFWEHQRRS